MTSAPAAAARITIAGPVGSIEALLEDPGLDGAGFAVICHPHPQFGGTMDNKVVTTLARAIHECGMASLRFNFRGVGASEGVFDHGIGETEDALAVLDWGRSRWPGRLVIAGFSFGAYVSMRVAQVREPDRVILVAPPVGRFDFARLRPPSCPWMVVQGDADDVVDPAAVTGWAGAVTPTPRLLVLPGVGHFFHRHLLELQDAVVDEIRSA